MRKTLGHSPTAFYVAWLACTCVFLLARSVWAEPLVFTQEPIQAMQQQIWALRNAPVDGCRIMRLDENGQMTNLTAEFTSAAFPCVSYDGESILFAGKQADGDNWNIWQMQVDGSDKAQVTRDMGDCWDPAYLALGSITPPEFTEKVRWITFVSNAPGKYDLYGDGQATALYAHTLETIEERGFVTWRTTFNLSSDFSPTMLNDGRILFSSWQHYGDRYAPSGKVALLTINWAGTGLNVFYGNHEGARVHTMAAEMPNRTMAFIESEGSTPDGAGNLARVSFRRPLHSRELLGEGLFRFPHPTSDGGMMVSYARDGQQYGLYRFDADQRQLGDLIFDDPEWNDVDAHAIMSQPEPQGRITIVTDSKDTGHLQCMNVYDSDQPDVQALARGSVKWVRFLEGLPPEAPRGAESAIFPPVRILGEATVEPDGSFYVHLPADTPVSMQLLDKDRISLKTMKGWMWVRQGSRRGCIGCHENKEYAPENRVTQALLKATAHDLLMVPEDRQQILFSNNVLPIIEQRCQRCHGGDSPRAGMDLNSDMAFRSLMATVDGQPEYVVPGEARNSRMTRLIYGRDGQTMPPNRPLSDEEKQRIAAWVDLGAQP